MEVHEGRKNHMCNECGKCFARPDKLRDHEKVHLGTGKSFSEALILASTNPQYDKRLLID